MRNNGTPTRAPIAGAYTLPTQQNFVPSPNQQYGKADPIPPTKKGITAQSTFHKINHSLMPGPVAKIIIRVQQARF